MLLPGRPARRFFCPGSLFVIDTIGDHTAVLFFSHRPEREWQNKQFVRQDYAKHRRVAGALYEHTRRAAQDSGLPVLEATDERQRGRGFGTRFANAVADAFAQGYEHVIAVGSDCPRLHEVDWMEVAGRLEAGTPVLGPTADRDGVYLIGLGREQFERDAFEALPWTTPALFPALARHLEAQAGTAPVRLAVRDDVNGHRDLLALVRRRGAAPMALRARLREVLGPIFEPTLARPARAPHHPRLRRRSRAPPTNEHTVSAA
ncbi:MAG: DUF2064 domain-containing protein [Salinibacter sp.]